MGAAEVSSKRSTVIVTGDIVVDRHLYEGERPTPDVPTERRGVHSVPEYGGANCIVRILQELRVAAPATISAGDPDKAKSSSPDAFHQQWDVHCGVALEATPPVPGQAPCDHDAYAVWRPFPARHDSDDTKRYWRAGLIMGYGMQDAAECRVRQPEGRSDLPNPRILVLDDAGYAFRTGQLESCWMLPPHEQPQPEWIVFKTSYPFAAGDLWRRVSSSGRERLVLIVGASDLRRECALISKGLSWERTVEDVRDELQRNPVLRGLLNCRHLLVSFSEDAVLWLDRRPEGDRATLIYDAGGFEGAWGAEFEGKAFGFQSCLVASVTQALMRWLSECDARTATPANLSKEPQIETVATPELGVAAVVGLKAMRRLRSDGHGVVESGAKSGAGYPAPALAREMLSEKTDCLPTGGFAVSNVPWGSPVDVEDRGRWMIIDSMLRAEDATTPRPLFGLARRVLLDGPGVLRNFPHASFGDALTIDRSEIETLRWLRDLLRSYDKQPKADRPLSIGVFGPPGAGKSFAVRQLANEVFGKEAWLEFNLSQFNGPADLCGAFHQIRDVVLSGKTPVAFWDEFDSKERFWLQYLLAPMQDGHFQEGNLTHGVGKCVFIFAGATSHSYQEFGAVPDEVTARRDFKLKKVPDFHSRLDGHLDVTGPNPRVPDGRGTTSGGVAADVLTPRQASRAGSEDVTYPARRALFIRAKLKSGDRQLDMDPALATALLEIVPYYHGSRSLEKVVVGLRPAVAGQAIRRSALPPWQQLGMHLEISEFRRLLESDYLFLTEENLVKLAKVIHETWLPMAPPDSKDNKPFDQLDVEALDDNRAAAARIPEILALVGLRLIPSEGDAGETAAAAAEIRKHLELLAEAEHVGWMVQRLKNGWTYSPRRDNKLKRHPALIPFAQLSEDDKKKDRANVLAMMAHAGKAGFCVGFIDSTSKT